MEFYKYKAREVGTGRIVNSEGQFESENHAKRYLIDNKLIPLSVAKKTAMTRDLKELTLFRKQVTLNDLVFFCKQFGVMLGAGISIGGALDILGKQSENPSMQAITRELGKDVQQGSNLSDAMDKHKEFPSLLINMVRSGEAAGNMDEIMHKMADHLEKQMELRRTVKKAMTYPALVVLTLVIVIPILMMFVIPGFVDIFEDTGVELPLATRIVMGVSDWMVAYWYVVIGIIAGTLVVAHLFKKTEAGKKIIDSLALKIPLMANLKKKAITALFSDTLALLMTSGVPVFQSLEIVRQVVGNSVAKEEMKQTLTGVREGNTISSSLEGSVIYPPMMISMLKIGEETGALDEMLFKTSDYYNKEVEVAVDQLITFIEPLLIAIIAVVVGGIMMAVMLPTFSIATDVM